MKAAVYTRYGPSDIVQITDVEKPVPKDDDVLIKVRAAHSIGADRVIHYTQEDFTKSGHVTT